MRGVFMKFNLGLNRMALKKALLGVCCLIMAVGIAACSNQNNGSTPSKLEYSNALEFMQTIWDRENINDKPSVFGGLGEDAKADIPGEVDLKDTDSIQGFLFVPQSLVNASSSAACVMNAMLSNDFTASAWQIKEGTELDPIVVEIEQKLKDTHWLCSFPEEYDILVQDDFVVVVFGKKAQVAPFVEAAEKVMTNAQKTNGLFEE